MKTPNENGKIQAKVVSTIEKQRWKDVPIGESVEIKLNATFDFSKRLIENDNETHFANLSPSKKQNKQKKKKKKKKKNHPNIG